MKKVYMAVMLVMALSTPAAVQEGRFMVLSIGTARDSTYNGYRGHVKDHLIPYYGETPITSINLDSVERFISDWCNKNGVSISTNKKILRAFSAIMGYACKKRLIDHNPVKDAEKPRKEVDLSEDETVEVYNFDQIGMLVMATGWIKKTVEKCDGDGKKQEPETLCVTMDRQEVRKYRTMIMMAVDTGM